MRVARLELKRAREILKRRTITSPVDGVVMERSLSPGEYAYGRRN
jgi:multidrug resistance efflux pump